VIFFPWYPAMMLAFEGSNVVDLGLWQVARVGHEAANESGLMIVKTSAEVMKIYPDAHRGSAACHDRSPANFKGSCAASQTLDDPANEGLGEDEDADLPTIAMPRTTKRQTVAKTGTEVSRIVGRRQIVARAVQRVWITFRQAFQC
jgi:hypothetical protein